MKLNIFKVQILFINFRFLDTIHYMATKLYNWNDNLSSKFNPKTVFIRYPSILLFLLESHCGCWSVTEQEDIASRRRIRGHSKLASNMPQMSLTTVCHPRIRDLVLDCPIKPTSNFRKIFQGQFFQKVRVEEIFSFVRDFTTGF